MKLRRPIFNVLSASLFVAGVAFAASPTPPPDPPPTVQSPTVLWVYGYPSPQWQIFRDYDVAETCTKTLATVKITAGQDAGCFRVGVNPMYLHEDYEAETPPAPKKMDEGE